MNLRHEQQQRDEFCKILIELAQSQELLQDSYKRASMYKRLENLYHAPKSQERFRHFYSDILSVLMQIEQNPTLGNIDILGQNLDVIRAGYQSINFDGNNNKIDISDALKKLYDHVNLEISRMLLNDAEERIISGEKNIRDIQSRISILNTSISEIAEIQKESERKIQSQQKEYITILGIFASIVIAFMGGTTFSSSVLNNILCTNIFKLSFVICLLGLVLINTIYMLERFIFIINNKEAATLKQKKLDLFFIIISLLSLIGYFFTQ